jgi:hypothetical protein
MVDTNQNFEHPNIPLAHQLREHVLYKITKEQWVKNAGSPALCLKCFRGSRFSEENRHLERSPNFSLGCGPN